MGYCTYTGVFRLAVVCQLIYAASCKIDAGSGMRVLVTEKTLQEINRVEVAEIEATVRGLKFKDVSATTGDVQWALTNLRVTSLDRLTAELDLQSDNRITWSGHGSSVTMDTDYRATYSTSRFGIPVTLSDEGSLRVDLSAITISMDLRLSVANGRLLIALEVCTSTISDVDLTFSGSSVSEIFDSLADIFMENIKAELQAALCESVNASLFDASNDMMDVLTLLDISMIGLPVELDTSFTAVAVSDDNIIVYTKAKYKWNDSEYNPADSNVDFLPKSDLGLGFDLETDAANSLLDDLATSGQLDGNLSYDELKDRRLDVLNLQCETSCIGNAFNTASQNFPDSVMGMHWSIDHGGMEVRKDELLGRLMGRVFFMAENADQSVNLFSAAMNLTTHLQARFAENKVSFRTAGLGGHILIDESDIGNVLSSEVEEVIQEVLREELIKKINDYKTDLPLELPARTNYKDAVIKLVPGVMRVEADICYKSDCVFAGKGDWVGNYTTDKFDIQDIISTPTTQLPPPTTSSKTTRPTTRPTPRPTPTKTPRTPTRPTPRPRTSQSPPNPTPPSAPVTTTKRSKPDKQTSGVDRQGPMSPFACALYTVLLVTMNI